MPAPTFDNLFSIRSRMNARRRRWFSELLLGAACFGCAHGQSELKYLGDKDLSYYKTAATTIDYPTDECPSPRDANMANRPRTVLDREKQEVWEITLAQAIQLAIQNNSIIRTRSAPGAPSAILTAGENVPSTYDAAIQETGVLFGGRGVEAALSAFDAQLTSAMIWARNDSAQNNAFGLGVGGTATPFPLSTETAGFTTQLSKQFATGAVFALGHSAAYSGNNLPAGSQVFRSNYSGNVVASFTQPLMAGAGTEYTRVAGPSSSVNPLAAQSGSGFNAIGGGVGGGGSGNFSGSITGVSQGVVIARINQDISLADFESSVMTMLNDVEHLYWELYLKYREYDTTVTNRNSALQSWREAHRILEAGGKPGFKPSDEAQARDFYFQSRSLSETALSNIYTAELSLRRILGLPVNDGRIMRPSEEPTTASFSPSWETSLTEALTQRVELRKQKWRIKSYELQLRAAESLTRPTLNFVSNYQVNGLGDDLLGHYNSSDPFRTMYGSITGGNFTGWNLGFQFQMPLGFRFAHAQVRNLEMRLAKARDQLQAQEIDISHEIAQDFQALAVQFTTAQSNFNRFQAAQQRVALFRAEVEAGTKTFDVLLRALASQAEAEVAYFRSLIEYNKAIVSLHYHKGTLLPHDHVWLSESDWTPDAYCDALRHAWARSHAIDAPHLETEPSEFVQQPGWHAQEFVPANDDATSPPAPASATSDAYEENLPGPPMPKELSEPEPTGSGSIDAAPGDASEIEIETEIEKQPGS